MCCKGFSGSELRSTIVVLIAVTDAYSFWFKMQDALEVVGLAGHYSEACGFYGALNVYLCNFLSCVLFCAGKIPPESTLIFNIDLLEIRNGPRSHESFQEMDLNDDWKLSKQEVSGLLFLQANLTELCSKNEKIR